MSGTDSSAPHSRRTRRVCTFPQVYRRTTTSQVQCARTHEQSTGLGWVHRTFYLMRLKYRLRSSKFSLRSKAGSRALRGSRTRDTLHLSTETLHKNNKKYQLCERTHDTGRLPDQELNFHLMRSQPSGWSASFSQEASVAQATPAAAAQGTFAPFDRSPAGKRFMSMHVRSEPSTGVAR